MALFQTQINGCKLIVNGCIGFGQSNLYSLLFDFRTKRHRYRPDVALVTSREGLPLAFEIFDGNRTDVTTTEEMVQIMENKYGKANRIWVMDRGMASEENIEFMQERGARYLVGTPKSMLRKFEQELLAKDWEEVSPGVEVKKCASPEGKALLEEMKELRSLDVVLPAKDKTIRLRVVSTPPKELKVLLQRMKILLPNRPKIIENVVEKIA